MPGISSLDSAFRFNGVISTDKTVLQNLETMCNASGCWLTYDVNEGLWAVVINEAGNSVASFNDSNILGGIQVSNTGLLDLYNAVKVSFPHVDLNDVRDFVRYEIPTGDRNPNEPDRDLNIEYDIFNDPVQADILAITELKQSRIDQIVSFATDYSMLGLKAGDIIDITNSVYGFTNKKFRITSIAEADEDGGSISLQITALEYSDGVYDLSDLYRYERSNLNGIVSIGAIGAPTTPILTVYELDSRPRLVANVQVPGIAPVEQMEMWYSSDNSNFELVLTQETVNGGTFTVGDYVLFDYDKAQTGNAYVKCRGLNSVTTGEFSLVATYENFGPLQAPNVIKAGTPIVDPNGQVLPSIDNASFFTFGLDDLVYYVANTSYQGSIFTSDLSMIAVNGTIPEVAYSVGTPSGITLDLGMNGMILNSSRTALGAQRGVAMYLASAPWDGAAYTLGGFGALSWSDWTASGTILDSTDTLTGNVFMGIDSAYSFLNDANANPYLIAIGFSTTIVPAITDYTVQIDPVSGISQLSFLVPYDNNTTLFDSGVGTYFPGRTGSPTPLASYRNAYLKIGIIR